MIISSKDCETLRSLAARYMEYALSDKNTEKRNLWYALNNMHMQKPMITIDQMPWHELDVDGFLVCTVEEPYFRGIEWMLRTEIYKWEHLPADMVLNPYILLPRPVSNTGFGMTTRRLDHDAGSSILCHLFEDQFEEIEDAAKIQTPVLTMQPDREEEILTAAHAVFDGIAPVQWSGIMLHSGLWDQITFWKGVENCYIDLLDRPELIHAILDRYTNAFISQIEQINRLGIYDINSNLCHCSHTFSDRLPAAGCNPDHPTTYDGWTFSMAQLFSSVSPAINEEFEVPYMTKIFSYFGSVYYGCCERLDDRLDIIDRMPNIRKISCSPWSDREHFAAVLPKKYIMSNKPNPSYLADFTFDEEVVRKDLRRTIAAAKAHGLGLELLLKDISTVRNDPARLWRWSAIAEEETMNAVL
ncbi:MAG: hypothetical protein E7631_04960 [Ruminococcaceae bacterium]|nr:hypothetical protein [Oscillospiraceae bacterium]